MQCFDRQFEQLDSISFGKSMLVYWKNSHVNHITRKTWKEGFFWTKRFNLFSATAFRNLCTTFATAKADRADSY